MHDVHAWLPGVQPHCTCVYTLFTHLQLQNKAKSRMNVTGGDDEAGDGTADLQEFLSGSKLDTVLATKIWVHLPLAYKVFIKDPTVDVFKTGRREAGFSTGMTCCRHCFFSYATDYDTANDLPLQFQIYLHSK